MISLLLAVNAFAAAEPDYCTPVTQVDPYVQYCYQNKFYVQAADLCIRKFEVDVTAFQLKLSASFRGHDQASAAAQQLKLDNTAHDLADTDAALKELLRRARIAHDNLVFYHRTIILPGDAKPEELGGAYGIYANTPCFRDNRLALEQRIADVEKKIAELTKTKATTEAMNATTGTRLVNLDVRAADAQKAAAATRAQGAARPVPQGQSRNPASTITGEIKWNELGHASK